MPLPARESRRRPGVLWCVASLLACSALAPTSAAAQGAPTAAPATSAVDASPVDASPVDAVRGGVVRGVVYDSSAGLPLAGAVVQLAPVGRTAKRVVSAVADSAGAFRVAGIAPGAWVVGFAHAALDAYGFEMPAGTVRLAAGDSVTVTLGLPGPEGLYRAVCGAAAAGAGAEDVGGVAGVVRDADTDVPAAGARVSIGWAALEVANGVRTVPRRVTATTGEDGAFSACGLPADVGLAVRVEAGAGGDTTRTSGELELKLAPATLSRLALAVGRPELVPPAPTAATPPADSTHLAAAGPTLRGEARLVGTVLDAQGAPVANARISVLDTGQEGVTNEAGAFVIAGLPSGSWTVEARALGFTPTRAPVVLSRARPARVSLELAAPVWTLKAVTVMARTAMRTRLMDELHTRTRRGGRLLTEDDLERQRPTRLTDALRTMPGLQAWPVYSGGVGQVLVGRRNCSPAVFIDGQPVRDGARDLDFLVHPATVLAIEVYPSQGGIPAQYTSLTPAPPCAVVGVWTKR